MSLYCIYGAGGHARDLLAQIAFDHGRTAVACLVDDFQPDREVGGIRVLDFAHARNAHGSKQWLIGLGEPRDRKMISERLQTAGLSEGFFLSSRANIAFDFVPATGVQIFSGSTVSLDVSIGRGSIINCNSVIAHESKLGEFVTLSPGCTIAGRVVIENGAFIGVGATIINGEPGQVLTVGSASIVGAGATVISSVDEGDTVAGVPARSLRRRNCSR
jgi:sugar O-acyltransferase (sialic acid O-acetyltransferase NeuD family)